MEKQLILLDENEAAHFLGGDRHPLSTRTLQAWRVKGVGPKYIKVGRLVRYPADSLEEFLK